jgi:hypothetical protein
MYQDLDNNKKSKIELIYLFLCIFMFTPFFFSDVPYGWNYFNYVALSDLYRQEEGPYYAVVSGILPNLGMALLSRPLMTMMQAEAATKLLWAFCFFGTTASIWFLWRQASSRTSASLLFMPFLLFNSVTTVSLMNFWLSMNVALFALAYWIRSWDGSPGKRILTFNVLAFLCALCHIAPYGMLLFVVGVMELFRGPVQSLIRRMSIAAAALIAGVLPVALAGRWDERFPVVAGPAPSPYFLVSGSGLSDAAGALALVLLLLVMPQAKRISWPTAPAWGILSLLALSYVIPDQIGLADMIQARFNVVAVICLITCLTIELSNRYLSLIVFLLCVLGAFRVVPMYGQWRDYGNDISSLRTAIEALPKGAKLLVTKGDVDVCGSRSAYAYQDAAALVVTLRAGFSHVVFTGRGMQPIELTNQARGMDLPWFAIKLSTLMELSQTPAAQLQPWAIRAHEWRQNFSHLLFLHLGCDQDEIAEVPGVDLLANSSVGAIYSIK